MEVPPALEFDLSRSVDSITKFFNEVSRIFQDDLSNSLNPEAANTQCNCCFYFFVEQSLRVALKGSGFQWLTGVFTVVINLVINTFLGRNKRKMAALSLKADCYKGVPK